MKRFLIAALLAATTFTASAQTTQTFEYDALGRLRKVTPSSGVPVCYAIDVADNRTKKQAATNCNIDPPPTNLPPVAVADFFDITWIGGPTTYTGNLNVLANDYDPNGDALTIISLTSAPAFISINPGGGSLKVTNGPVGTYNFSYTIQDTLGLTATGPVQLILCRGAGCA